MPVRLLHTSDWHLGHELHDMDRAPEHRLFLRWLIDRCVTERVHALLVAGDVFDASNPPASALALWAEFLVELWQRMSDIQVVVIGGNHDSAHRLEMTEPFHRALRRLHVLGAVPRAGSAIDLDRALVRVEGETGAAIVVAVPFLRPADLCAADLDGDLAAPVRRVLDEAFAGARALRGPTDAIVAMGHLFVSGSQQGQSERTLVGGMGAVPADVFPPDVAYAALGHLHRAQAIAGRIRYCGSPIPLSFDEAAHAQEVVLVTLSGGALQSAQDIPVPRARPLLRIPADGPAPLSVVLEALSALPPLGGTPPDERPLLEVRVQLERPEPALRDQLDAALAGKAARLVRVQTARGGDRAALPDRVAAQALADLDPVQVFVQRWKRDYPGEPPADVLAAYGEVLEQARQEEAP